MLKKREFSIAFYFNELKVKASAALSATRGNDIFFA